MDDEGASDIVAAAFDHRLELGSDTNANVARVCTASCFLLTNIKEAVADVLEAHLHQVFPTL